MQSHLPEFYLEVNQSNPFTVLKYLPYSPAPPTDHAKFDLFLKAMTTITERERHGQLAGQRYHLNEILDALTTR